MTIRLHKLTQRPYLEFYRRFGCRKVMDLVSKKFVDLSEMVIPHNTVWINIPFTDTEVVPPKDYFMLQSTDDLIYCRHATNLQAIGGFPIKINMDVNGFVRKLQRENPKLRKIISEPSINSKKTNMVLYNYATLNKMYRYKHHIMTFYYQWMNIFHTALQEVNDITRDNPSIFIPIEVPATTKGTLERLRRLNQKEFGREDLRILNTPQHFAMIELWKLFGNKPSAFDTIKGDKVHHVNLILHNGSHGQIINLASLIQWRNKFVMGGDEFDEEVTADKGKSLSFQKRLMLIYARLIVGDRILDDIGEGESETEILPGEPDEDGDITPVMAKPKETEEERDDRIDEALTDATLEVGVAVTEKEEPEHEEPPLKEEEVSNLAYARVLELAEAGKLTYKETLRWQKKIEESHQIPYPGTDETLAEFAKVSPEVLAISEKGTTIPDSEQVVDKSMLKSTNKEFIPRYVKEVMRKDIVSAVMAIERGGCVIEKFEIESVVDAAGAYDLYRVQVSVIGGGISTVAFRIPQIDSHGVWKADGTNYRLRIQRGDPPIHKTAPDTVALTSYDGKIFINRSDKVVYDYDLWLQEALIAKYGLQETITQLNYASPIKAKIDRVLPRLYTGLGKRFAALHTAQYQFTFDYGAIHDNFTKDEIRKADGYKAVPVGHHEKGLIILDNDDNFSIVKGSKIELIGDVDTLFDINTSSAPIETAYMGAAGKQIPIGLVMCYFEGFTAVLKRMGINPTVVDTAGRHKLARGSFSVVFRDKTFIFERSDRKAALLFGAFREYKPALRRRTVAEMNNPQFYFNILQEKGLGTRELRWLDNARKLFIDPITLELLEAAKEPTTFIGLLRRSVELLTFDYVPLVPDRLKGYERIPGAVYKEVSTAIKRLNSKAAGSKNKVEVNPFAVWQKLQSDPAVALVEDINPINNLKEIEAVTFGGHGGRSSATMTKPTRAYKSEDFGVISESTKDSSEVAISTYLSANPNILDLRGNIKVVEKVEDVSIAQAISTSAMIAPASLHDDPKRTNFLSTHNSSTIAGLNYTYMPIVTGGEATTAHRVSDLYAFAAKQDGKVVEVAKNVIVVEYKDGTREGVEIGVRFGVAAGSIYKHPIVTDMVVDEKFKAGHVIAWNAGFYRRHRFAKGEVIALTGVLVNIGVIDQTETYEDSSVFSEATGKLLANTATYTRVVMIRFDQELRELLAVGDHVEPDSILALIEDKAIAQIGEYSEAKRALLADYSNQKVKADHSGLIERVEVFYRGSPDDMSESLAAIVKKYDREKRKLASKLTRTESPDGRVLDRFRVDGKPLEDNSVAFRFYITHDNTYGVGDKGNLMNQLKTVTGKIIKTPDVTKSGLVLQGRFSGQSIFNRIVLSPYIIGTASRLVLASSKRAADIYFGEL